MSNPNPPTPRWFLWLGLLGLLGYGAFIAHYSTSAAGGSDSSGYFNSAKLIAAGQIATEVRWPRVFAEYQELFWPDFQPLGFRATAESERMAPTYPTGLPLHLVAAGAIFGWQHGPWLLGTVGAMFAVVLCYAFGRGLGLSRELAAAGALILAVMPIWLLIVIQPLSDALAATWALAAGLAALRAGRPPAGRGNVWAFACGAACGMAVLVRPTTAVVVPALSLLLGLRWRLLLAATAGGLPFLAWLAWYNHMNYGGAFTSGYAPISASFMGEVALPTVRHFLKWLALFVPTVLLISPIVLLTRREERTRETLALVLWIAAIFGLYTFYYFSHEAWSGLRFILPAMPPLIVLGLLGLESLLRRRTDHQEAWRRGCAVALVVWAVGGSSYWWQHLGLFQTRHYENTYATAAQAASAQFPRGSLVVCSLMSGAVYYYTDFPVLRWDHINRMKFEGYSAIARRAALPIRALVFNVEEEAALREHCPGRWVRLAQVADVGLWQLEYPPGSD